MGMSFAYATRHDDVGARATLEHAVEVGGIMLDTAEIYGPYTNEALIGEVACASPSKRERVVLAAKLGFEIVDGVTVGFDSRPSASSSYVDASLRRLRTDRIDLLYQHRVDPAMPIEEVAEHSWSRPAWPLSDQQSTYPHCSDSPSRLWRAERLFFQAV